MKLDGCSGCGAKALRRTEKMLTREVGGHSFRAKVPATRCGRCGDVLFASADLRRFDDAVAVSLLGAGITRSDGLKFVRKAMGMRADELARLLGVRPETVSRWENGKREVDLAMLAVLRQLFDERHARERPVADLLRRLQRPAHLGKTVRLKLAS